MTDKTLEHAQPGAVFADHCRRRIGSDPLIDDFDPASCRGWQVDPSNRAPDTDRRCGRHMRAREWDLALQMDCIGSSV